LVSRSERGKSTPGRQCRDPTALRFRPIGERVAQAMGTRQGGSHPLRGRCHLGIPTPSRRRSVPAEFRERLGRFGLELHPDNTRRIEFGRFAEQNRKRRGEGKPETFDFLGFKHISGKNRLGRFTVRRKTIRKRMGASCGRLSSSSASACTIRCAKPANGSSRLCRVTTTTMR
jgi:hypothetical protein